MCVRVCSRWPLKNECVLCVLLLFVVFSERSGELGRPSYNTLLPLQTLLSLLPWDLASRRWEPCRVEPCGSVESQPCTHRRADGSWVPKELLKRLKNAQSSKLKAHRRRTSSRTSLASLRARFRHGDGESLARHASFFLGVFAKTIVPNRFKKSCTLGTR